MKLTSGLRRFAVGAVGVATLLAAPCPARADRTPVSVELRECAGMDAGKVERLLAIELTSVTDAGSSREALGVLVECKDTVVRIAVRDPLTAKSIEREIPAPSPSEPGAERVIALAASQLFVASWLELLVPGEETTIARAPASPVARAARSFARTAMGPPSASAIVGLLGEVRVRDVAEPFSTLSLGGRAATRLAGRWWLHAAVRFEAGSTSRESGEVDLRGAFLAAGIGFRFARLGTANLELTAALSGGWMELSGRPHDVRFAGGATDSLTGEVFVGFGPTLPIGPLEIGLELRVGVMPRTPLGLVRGEPEVSPGGPWAGAALSVCHRLGGR